MAPSMKNMGPACCCCNHLYVGFSGANPVERYDTVGIAPGEAPGYGFEKSTGADNRQFDFDPVHKIIFTTRGTAGQARDVARFDADLANRLLLTTTGGSEFPCGVTSDPDNQRIFYTTTDFPITATNLYSINHDGSGGAFVAALTTSTTAIHPIHYCRSNAKLYYVTWPTFGRLDRINADGTGNTNLAVSATPNGRIEDCTVDHTGGYIYWTDNAANVGQTSRIYRADFDGAGASAILTGNPISAGEQERFYGPQWSHRHQRLYVWRNDIMTTTSADLTRGLVSMNADGSDYRLEIARGNGTDWWLFGSAIPFEWRLGCGYESLGAGSPA